MDIKKLMKQAQTMQKKMQEMQEEIAKKEFEGKSGGGLVSVIMSGSGEMHKVNVDQSLIKENEKEMKEKRWKNRKKQGKKKVKMKRKMKGNANEFEGSSKNERK